MESAELLLEQAAAREELAVEHELLRLATRTDALTGIGNRRAWDRALAAVLTGDGKGPPFVVVSADLDGMKGVNDVYGHPAGDAVIRGAANILRSSVRDCDAVARAGGDELLVLLTETDSSGGRAVMRRIRRAMAAWRVTEFGLTPALSLGWAGSDDQAATSVERADAAMYQSKRRRSKVPASTSKGRYLRLVSSPQAERRKLGAVIRPRLER